MHTCLYETLRVCVCPHVQAFWGVDSEFLLAYKKKRKKVNVIHVGLEFLLAYNYKKRKEKKKGGWGEGGKGKGLTMTTYI